MDSTPTINPSAQLVAEDVPRLGSRKLGFNLEPTFRCNLSCPMCPRFSSTDPHLDMTWETFSRIAAHFDLAHTVDFTGWGEPMMHKGLYRMIAAARESGCAVTSTSNGTALTEENARRLIESGLNVLTVSIDGLDGPVYEAVRVGASFVRVTENLKTVSRLIGRQPAFPGSSPMSLGIAFTIQESNYHQLPLVVDWVAGVGASVLHLKHLNVVSTAEDMRNSLLKYRLQEPGFEECQSQPARLLQVEEQISRIRQASEERGIRVLVHSEYPLTARMQPRHCLAAPLDAVYFSYDGRVSPCCHFGHTVSRYFQGRVSPPKAFFLGDIKKQDFPAIWNSPDFLAFRNGFATRNYPEACRSCYLLYGK